MKKNKSKPSAESAYSSFAKINGKHPLQKKVSDSYILYKARYRRGGKVSFFNFDLAKEMALISKKHPNQLNQNLEKEILNTFSLVIINEYDIENRKKFAASEIKENFYMATRYLQLQHKDNVGISSGDGRSIWNGQISNNGKTWDISSCGSGATRLSPATSIHNKFFQTGDPSISYGCGYAEYDEGLGAAIMSEIFNKNKIPTERVLAIIEFPNNIAITVRAYSNLLRPSHFFLHLKQKNRESLKALIDYYIEQQIKNNEWKIASNQNRYQYFLEKITDSFAKVSALFEDEYIFCWMDWDGDNILMDGGIIDYGSIRQFGLYHHEYRFDDDDRFSTSISEQKYKAKYIVQSFVQAIDFILNETKRPINKFKKHKIMKDFEKKYQSYKDQNLVFRMGFNKEQRTFLLKNKLSTIRKFRKVFSYFETTKSKEGLKKVEDGITCNAIFCMRDILRELPQLLANKGNTLSASEFIEVVRSSYASDEDLLPNTYRNKQTKEFQKQYLKLIKALELEFKSSNDNILLELAMRSNIINKMDRITGDSVTCIVEEIQAAKPKLSTEKLYELIEDLKQHQAITPKDKGDCKTDKKDPIFYSVYQYIKEYREGL